MTEHMRQSNIFFTLLCKFRPVFCNRSIIIQITLTHQNVRQSRQHTFACGITQRHGIRLPVFSDRLFTGINIDDLLSLKIYHQCGTTLFGTCILQTAKLTGKVTETLIDIALIIMLISKQIIFNWLHHSIHRILIP